MRKITLSILTICLLLSNIKVDAQTDSMTLARKNAPPRKTIKLPGGRATASPPRPYQANWESIKANYQPTGISILKSTTGKPEGTYVKASTITDWPFVNRKDPTLFQDDDLLLIIFPAPSAISMKTYRAAVAQDFLKTRKDLYGKVLEDNVGWWLLGSETSSAVSSRGIYYFPVTNAENQGKGLFQENSYDLYAQPWATTADDEFKNPERHLNIYGEFVRTGFDYLG